MYKVISEPDVAVVADACIGISRCYHLNHALDVTLSTQASSVSTMLHLPLVAVAVTADLHSTCCMHHIS